MMLIKNIQKVCSREINVRTKYFFKVIFRKAFGKRFIVLPLHFSWFIKLLSRIVCINFYCYTFSISCFSVDSISLLFFFFLEKSVRLQCLLHVFVAQIYVYVCMSTEPCKCASSNTISIIQLSNTDSNPI